MQKLPQLSAESSYFYYGHLSKFLVIINIDEDFVT